MGAYAPSRSVHAADVKPLLQQTLASKLIGSEIEDDELQIHKVINPIRPDREEIMNEFE